MDLTYKTHALIEDLQLNECTIHRAGSPNGARWWNLWFYVKREDNGELADFVVPVNPGGSYMEKGPGGRTWGFTEFSGGIWLIAPSIDVHKPNGYDLATAPGPARVFSTWHQTPRIVGVPSSGEPWMP